METRVEIVAIVCMLIVGISHIVHPRAWVEFFTWLRERGEAGVFAAAFLHLPLALLIIVCHPRWTGIAAVLTVLGWAWMLKATIYFVFPRVGLIGLSHVSHERAREFVWGGWVLIGLAALLAYPLLIS